jgi:hypothetical protein
VTFELIILPPLSQALTITKIRKSRGLEIPNEVEPQETGIKGAYVARMISRIYDALELRVLKENQIAKKEVREDIVPKRDHDGPSSKSDEIVEAYKYQNPGRNKREGEAATSGACYCIMKMLNTRLEPIPLGKNVVIGLVEEFREKVNPRAGDEVTCEEIKKVSSYCDNCDSCDDDDRREIQGSLEPFSEVMVVEGNPQNKVKELIEYINKEVIK